MVTLEYENILDNFPKWWVVDSDSNNYKFTYSFQVTFTELDTNLTNFKQGWQINYAIGNDLDKIAQKYNLVRNQYDTDDSFRAKIKSYLPVFSGSGSKEDIKAILSFLTSLEEDDITFTDIREMVFSIIISIDASTDPTILNEIVDIVPDIKAAGTYVLDISYASKGNIFLTNLSTTNGEDKIL